MDHFVLPPTHLAARGRAIAVSLVLALLTFAGHASTATGAVAHASAPTRLTVAVNSDIGRTDWATKHDDVTQMVLHHIVEGLVAYREDMTVGPSLAERWSVSEDGRRYTFTLRSGVRFHNGKVLTAEIVKANWNRLRDSGQTWGSKCRGLFDGSEEQYLRPANIIAISAPDERTVVFDLQYRNGLFLHHMASHHCISGIVHPDSFDSAGQWVTPIGTGPFRLVAWNKGLSVELKRFEGYGARGEAASGFTGTKTAKVDELTFRVYADRAAAQAALESGQVDAWHNVPQDVALRLQGRSGVDLHFQETPAFHQLVLQSRHDPLLRDVRMRQALAMAIDRARVAREVTGGRGQPNPSVVATSLPWYSERHRTSLPFDPARAISLAREAGYANQPLRIQASRTPYPSFMAAAEASARQLRAAGFNAVVEEVSWPDQDKNYANNKYQISSITFSTRTDPAQLYAAIIGQKTDHSWYLWEDVEAEMLANRAAIESDPAIRQQMFDTLHARMTEWTPTIGLYNHFVFTATANGVKGFRPWALGLSRFWEVSR